MPKRIVLPIVSNFFKYSNGVSQQFLVNNTIIRMRPTIAQNGQIAISPAQKQSQLVAPLCLRHQFNSANTQRVFVCVIPLLNFPQ